MRLSIVIAIAALAGLSLGLSGPAQPPRGEFVAQDEPQLEEGIDIQTRGPVHEAFAQPISRDPEPSPLVRKQPPEPVPEMPPEMKPEGEASVWIPGYWAFDGEREDYLWVSGTWRVPPPERTWVPGYWDDDEGGWRWVSGYWAVENEAQIEVYPEPPEPIAEAIPAPPEENMTYVPGNWVYRETRYFWRPGYHVHYRPGWVWVNACYYWTPAGYVFLDGYWDLDVHRRGLLFSPVYFHRPFWQRAGWHYRPHYCVATNFLFNSLFVNVGWRHYYFGDYYEARYLNRGYHPWVTYRYGGGRYYDPLFAYYRWQNRDRDGWEDRLRTTYVARREGQAPRPPRTFQEQQRLSVKQGDNDVRVVVPIRQITKVHNNIKLAPVTKIELQQSQKTAQQFQKVRQDRARVEAKVRTEGRGKGAAKGPVRLQVQHAQMPTAAKARQDAPPPRPATPKAIEQKARTGQPRVRDVDPPKERDLPPKGKGKDLTPPKGKDLTPPKGKDLTPPKGKGKDLTPPKGRDLDPRDRDLPKGRDVTPPKGRDLDPPKGRDLDPRKKGKPRDDDAVRPRDPPAAREAPPRPREVRPDPDDPPRPTPRPEKKKGKDRDRDKE